jgi:hypothetical protein
MPFNNLDFKHFISFNPPASVFKIDIGPARKKVVAKNNVK